MYYTIYAHDEESDKMAYVALAKHTPFIIGQWLTEPGEIWFEIGETKESALIKLKESLPGHYWTQ